MSFCKWSDCGRNLYQPVHSCPYACHCILGSDIGWDPMVLNQLRYNRPTNKVNPSFGDKRAKHSKSDTVYVKMIVFSFFNKMNIETHSSSLFAKQQEALNKENETDLFKFLFMLGLFESTKCLRMDKKTKCSNDIRTNFMVFVLPHIYMTVHQ